MTRKIQRENERSNLKQKKQVMKKAFETFDGMPKKCGECDADFDNTVKEALSKWRVAVYDDGRVHLTCPDCGPTPEELENADVE
jgi:hypothetical protein